MITALIETRKCKWQLVEHVISISVRDIVVMIDSNRKIISIEPAADLTRLGAGS